MSKKAKFRMRLTPWQGGERIKCSAMHRHVCLRLSMDEIWLWIVRFYITSLRTPLTRNRGGGAVVFTTGSSP